MAGQDGESALPLDTLVTFALWDLAYHGGGVTLRCLGKGPDIEAVECAGHSLEGHYNEDEFKQAVIRWAHAVRNRGANNPIPPPPSATGGEAATRSPGA